MRYFLFTNIFFLVLRCDPLKLLIQFLGDKGIRPVDLFRSFDRDNQHRVSRDQFVIGLKVRSLGIEKYVQIYFPYN